MLEKTPDAVESANAEEVRPNNTKLSRNFTQGLILAYLIGCQITIPFLQIQGQNVNSIVAAEADVADKLLSDNSIKEDVIQSGANNTTNEPEVNISQTSSSLNATIGEVTQREENQEPLAATGEEAERLTQSEETAAKEPQNTEKDQVIEEAISKEIIAKEPEAPTTQEATKLVTEDNKEDTKDSRVSTEAPPAIPAASKEDLSIEHPPVNAEDKKAEAIVEVVVDESTSNSVEAESVVCMQPEKVENTAIEQKDVTEDSVITSPTKIENLEDDVQNVEKDIIDNTKEELISNSSIADPASNSEESIEKSVLIENTSQATAKKDMVVSVGKIRRIEDTFGHVQLTDGTEDEIQQMIHRIQRLLLGVEKNEEGELAQPLIIHYTKLRLQDQRMQMLSALD